MKLPTVGAMMAVTLQLGERGSLTKITRSKPIHVCVSRGVSDPLTVLVNCSTGTPGMEATGEYICGSFVSGSQSKLDM
jgi:hypothetical protein